jgi:allophanate hydrolase subunit 1
VKSKDILKWLENNATKVVFETASGWRTCVVHYRDENDEPTSLVGLDLKDCVESVTDKE